ncbi:alcohol oxidase [Cristinia sonorae]|uniref:Alcohol oxidase n=1 Tax=Cristinia sonorae TaxID=1940300 RepID=A0A8K0XRF9_9AGAR|nr:alcohol oxidase [Cristinia sonorae]
MVASLNDVLAKGSFDYIIIGAGTAGLTLAARLTEDPSNTVLVLEAGKENIDDPNLLRPASYGSHFGNDLYSWDHRVSKQVHAPSAVDRIWHRRLAPPSGKGLGGSSAINFMCYTRPDGEDINDFERLGNPGWNFKHFDRLARKFEGYVPPTDPNTPGGNLRAAEGSLGTDGPLKLSYPPAGIELEILTSEALKKNGVSTAADPFGGDINGFWLTPNTYDPVTHTRTYSSTAFYLPNRGRPNLTVLTGALVSRIVTKVIEGVVTATGVAFQHGGDHVVTAVKEVIVCAGALKSPQILELSGIGRKEVLERIGVPVQIDLRGVGENVQEHFWHSTSYELKDDVTYDTLDLLRNPETAEEHLKLHVTGTGIYTSGIIGFAFIRPESVSAKAPEVFQNAKAHILKNWDSYSPELQAQYKIHLARIDRKSPSSELILQKGMMSFPNPPVPGKKYITFFNCVNHALSRGTIHATSNNPSQDPDFDPHYFEMEADLQILVEQLHFARKLAETSPLKDIIARELNPGPNVQSDEQIKEWISNYLGSTWHTGCSCSMMPREIGGVVDTNLTVYGTSNIRVVDLSVIPIQFAAHPMSVVYAMAEHAAEVIRGKA